MHPLELDLLDAYSFEEIEEKINHIDFKRMLINNVLASKNTPKTPKKYLNEIKTFLENEDILNNINLFIYNFQLRETTTTHSKPLSKNDTTDTTKYNSYQGRIYIKTPIELWEKYMISGSDFLKNTIFNIGSGGGNSQDNIFRSEYSINLWELDFKNLKTLFPLSSKVYNDSRTLFPESNYKTKLDSLNKKQLQILKKQFLSKLKTDDFLYFPTLNHLHQNHFPNLDKQYFLYLKKAYNFFFNNNNIDSMIKNLETKNPNSPSLSYNYKADAKSKIVEMKGKILSQLFNSNLLSDNKKESLLKKHLHTGIFGHDIVENHPFTISKYLEQDEHGKYNFFNYSTPFNQTSSFLSNKNLRNKLPHAEEQIIPLLDNFSQTEKDSVSNIVFNSYSKKYTEINNPILFNKLSNFFLDKTSRSEKINSTTLKLLQAIIDSKTEIKSYQFLQTVLPFVENQLESFNEAQIEPILDNVNLKDFKETLIQLHQQDLNQSLKNSNNHNKFKM